jgi:outer membrane protein OmpA-like peptidoglycan-associated protein
MRKGLRTLGPENQTLVMFEDFMDSRSLFLTANTTTIYSVVWLNTTEPRIAGVKMRDIRFGFNEFDVLSEYQSELNKLADFLTKNPNTYVVMAGFTDSVGTEAYNLPLSKRRVKSVANYLEQQGVGMDRMTLLWYGKTNPLANNSTREGRAKNRRVEVAVGGM